MRIYRNISIVSKTDREEVSLQKMYEGEKNENRTNIFTIGFRGIISGVIEVNGGKTPWPAILDETQEGVSVQFDCLCF